jgi:hypothetical protein
MGFEGKKETRSEVGVGNEVKKQIAEWEIGARSLNPSPKSLN